MDVHPSGDHLIVGGYDRKLCWFDLELSARPYKVLRFGCTRPAITCQVLTDCTQVPHACPPCGRIPPDVPALRVRIRRRRGAGLPREGVRGPDERPAAGPAQDLARARSAGRARRARARVGATRADAPQRRRGRLRERVVCLRWARSRRADGRCGRVVVACCPLRFAFWTTRRGKAQLTNHRGRHADWAWVFSWRGMAVRIVITQNDDGSVCADMFHCAAQRRVIKTIARSALHLQY
jgi:hypothetical protein